MFVDVIPQNAKHVPKIILNKHGDAQTANDSPDYHRSKIFSFGHRGQCLK